MIAFRIKVRTGPRALGRKKRIIREMLGTRAENIEES